MSLSLTIRSRFDQAVDAAAVRRVLLPDDYYGAIPVRERSRAFTVSRLAAASQIQQVLDEMSAALAEGKAFADWQREAGARPELAALPMGRMETIYRNAVQTAYHAGHWEGHQQAKKRRPYLMYDAINDSRTRPTHKAMDGYIAPVDDAIWLTHYPPNGHRCRCTVISLTQAQAEARGWAGAATVPMGEPDAGWAHHPALGHDEAMARLVSDMPAPSPATPTAGPGWLGQGATPDEVMQAGRPVLDRLLDELPPPVTTEGEATEGWAKRFRAEVLAGLAALRPVGGKIATLQASGEAVSALAEVAALLPSDWIVYGNAVSIDAGITKGHAYYMSAADKVRQRSVNEVVNAATIRALASSSMMHEYMRHLQAMVPGLGNLFQRSQGKRDVAKAFEALLGGAVGGSGGHADGLLADMASDDKDMLALAIGAMMRYRP